MPENPFPGDNIGAVWTRNEGPGVVEKKSIILLLHGVEPVGVEESRFVRVRNGRDRSG